MNRSIAQILSYLLHPAVYPILGVLVILSLSPYHITPRIMLLSLALVFVGTYVVPVALSYLLYRTGFIENLEMKRAEDRRVPYLIGALSYYFVATVLNSLQLPYEAYLFLVSSTAVVVLHMLLLTYFKPSAHMAGIGGFAGLLFALSLKFSLNLLPLLALAILLSGFLASARYKLRAHTMGELVFGFFSGLVGVFGVVYFVGNSLCPPTPVHFQKQLWIYNVQGIETPPESQRSSTTTHRSHPYRTATARTAPQRYCRVPQPSVPLGNDPYRSATIMYGSATIRTARQRLRTAYQRCPGGTLSLRGAFPFSRKDFFHRLYCFFKKNTTFIL